MSRILMVVRPSKGGAFGHVARLGRALAERGHAVAVAGPHASQAAALDPVEVLPFAMGRAIAPLEDARAIAALARACRRWRPDLIHAHGSKGGVAARLARVAAPRAPLVFTPHNYAFTNYFASSASQRVFKLVELALAPLATRTLCVCEAERRLAASIGVRRRARVVHNGVVALTPEPPPPEVRAIAARGPLVCAVTELQEPKGVPTLIEAMPAVLERHPDAQLAIAGDGPMRAEVEDLIARLGLARSVHLLGQIDGVAGLLGCARVFAAPGWSESFPYANLEAMSLGLAIVATDVGGVREAIEDGVTGRLVPAQDAPALAAAIGDLLSDPAAAGRLGAAARERMLARFTFERMLAGTLAVYAELGVG